MGKNKGLTPGSQMPSFTLEGADGKTYHSKQWKGQDLLLMFHGGTWCPSCRFQLTQMSKHYATFKELGVEVVSILGQKRDSVVAYLEKHPLPFPVLVDETRDVIKAFEVYHPIGIDAFNIARPSLFLISSEQKIVYAYISRHQRDLPHDHKLVDKIHAELNQALEE